MSSQPFRGSSTQGSVVPNLSKTQSLYLIEMPEEILRQISEDKSLDRNSVRNLVLTSRKLNRICKPRFYKDFGYMTFRIALMYLDLDTAKRCAAYGAAPVNYKLSAPPGTSRIGYGNIEQTPITLLISLLKARYSRPTEFEIPAKKCYEVLKWLLDNGADPNQSAPVLTPFACMLSFLTAPVRSREDSDFLHRMAHLLIDRGASIPEWVWPIECFGDWEDRNTLNRPWLHGEEMITFCLQMTIDESLLEKWLTNLQNKGVRLANGSDEDPDVLKWRHKYHVYDSHCTIDIKRFLLRTYSFFINPSHKWQEKYKGEAIEIFVKKIDILVKYYIIDDVEERCLRQLAITAGEIYDKRTLATSQSNNAQLYSWYQLCKSISCLAERSYKQAEDDLERTNDERYNRLVVNPEWNPRWDFVWLMWSRRYSKRICPSAKTLTTLKAECPDISAREWFDASYEQWRIGVDSVLQHKLSRSLLNKGQDTGEPIYADSTQALDFRLF